jgi:hypothetical protein
MIGRMASEAQQLELLFKKYSGVGDAYPGLSVNKEVPVSARPGIFTSQIYAETIPSVAPTDLIQDGTFSNGQRWVSTANPHIVQYRYLTLGSINPGFSYRYSGTNLSSLQSNLLSHVIPGIYDPAGSYQYTVYSSTMAVIQRSDSTHPWVLDTDVGILTFFHTEGFPQSNTPTITFWRYEGTFGIGLASKGDTGYTGAQGDRGYTGAQGADGGACETGATGAQGDTGYTGAQGQAGHASDTGATGSQGDTGYTGAQGQGYTGDTGTRGHTGYTGAQGFQGAQGLQGYTGETGSQGSSGTQIYGNSGVPSVSVGKIGDFYIDYQTGLMYLKS